MQMICCASHQEKSITPSLSLIKRNRKTTHQDIFKDLLLLCGHGWKCPIIGEDLSALDDSQIDGHHMYFLNALGDFGTAWCLASDEIVTRKGMRDLIPDCQKIL